MAGLTREQLAERKARDDAAAKAAAAAVFPPIDKGREWLDITVRLQVAKMQKEGAARPCWDIADDILAHYERRRINGKFRGE